MGPLGQTARVATGEIESGETSVGYTMFVYLIWAGGVILFYVFIVGLRFFKRHFVDMIDDCELID